MPTNSKQTYRDILPHPPPPSHAMPHPNMHPAHFSPPPHPASRNVPHWNYPPPPHHPHAYPHPASSAHYPHHPPPHHTHPHSPPPRTSHKQKEMEIIQRDFPNIHRLIEHQTKTIDMQNQEMNRLSQQLHKIQQELNTYQKKEKVPPVILVGKSSDSSSRISVTSMNKRTVSREESSQDLPKSMPCKKRFKSMEDRDVKIDNVLATLQAATCKTFASGYA